MYPIRRVLLIWSVPWAYCELPRLYRRIPFSPFVRIDVWRSFLKVFGWCWHPFWLHFGLFVHLFCIICSSKVFNRFVIYLGIDFESFVHDIGIQFLIISWSCWFSWMLFFLSKHFSRLHLIIFHVCSHNCWSISRITFFIDLSLMLAPILAPFWELFGIIF